MRFIRWLKAGWALGPQYSGLAPPVLHKVGAHWLTLSKEYNAVLFTYTSQLLSNFHLLPIHKRTHFKVATLTYKVLSVQQPAYLYNLISYHQSSHLLRSSSQSLLHVHRIKTDFGRHAFSTNLSYTYCYQSLTITWLLQTSPQNSLLLTI